MCERARGLLRRLVMWIRENIVPIDLKGSEGNGELCLNGDSAMIAQLLEEEGRSDLNRS